MPDPYPGRSLSIFGLKLSILRQDRLSAPDFLYLCAKLSILAQISLSRRGAADPGPVAAHSSVRDAGARSAGGSDALDTEERGATGRDRQLHAWIERSAPG